MTQNDFQYGECNSYTLQCGTIMTLISPGDCTLQCGMWLWNQDSEFTKWQHPAKWYVAVGWYAVEFAGGSTLQCGKWLWDDMPWNSPKRSPYWNSTYGFEFVILHQSAKFYPNWTTLSRKITSCRLLRWRISATLDFTGPIMGSLKSPCTTSYRLSINTMALNCLVFEKMAFLI